MNKTTAVLTLQHRWFLSLIIAASSYFAWPSVALTEPQSEIAIFVHPANKCARFSSSDIEKIFTTVRSHWDGGKPILAFNLPAKSPIREQFDRVVLGMDPETIGKYWIDRRIRGGNPPPRTAPEATIVVRVVANSESAIGYAPTSVVDASVRVIARVSKGKLVSQ
jgi:ABC-type phosphate transport system substrate-binding protein